MSEKHTYEVTFTHKNEPTNMRRTTRQATSVSEAKNIVKADEARRGHAITVVACVKR